jgi:AraC-like DNA-binding protein
MKRALAAIASGANIKKAASIAGFTDAAHFNRTFLSMFGDSPSNLLK